MSDQNLSIRTVYNHMKPRRVGSIKLEPIHTLDVAFSLLDREAPPPSLKLRAQSDPIAIIPDFESSPQVRHHSRQIVAEELAQENAKKSLQATKQAVENASFDIFLPVIWKRED